LSDPKKRRQWDSCDPKISYEIPKPNAPGDFFDIYRPIFKRESRFSKNGPSKPLGDLQSSREDVELFYGAWFSFESWRTFEQMDEECADNSDSRDEKRWLDKKNRSQRQKLKKEDSARISKLAEQAFSLDPRIRQFKADEKVFTHILSLGS
jgi:DnaJ family protein C protein 2